MNFSRNILFFIGWLIIAAPVLSGCFSASSAQDTAIDEDLRTKIDGLNKQVVTALNEGNLDRFKAICSDSMQKLSGKGLDSLMQQTRGILTGKTFKIRNQFFQNGKKGEDVWVTTGKTKDHDYSIHYQAINHKSFVTVGYFEDTARTISLTTIWGNYNGEWKLNLMRVGVLKALGLDAVDWYTKAQQLYQKGEYIDAYNKMEMCKALLRPATDLWKYAKEDEMITLGNDLESIVKNHYPLPMAVDDVKTHPSIIGVSSQIFTDGFYPVISYTTKLNLHDSASLSRECDSINAHVGDLFPGLDHNNKMLLYRAYNEVPTAGHENVSYYWFLKKSLACWY